jgi:protein-tyrosine-phosphatase
LESNDTLSYQTSIEVACRLNQARSVAISTFLRWRYPEFMINSSGIEATTGAPVNEAVTAILNNWGFTSVKADSTASQDQLKRIRSANFVIAADNHVKQQLLRLGIPDQKIIDLNKEIEVPFLKIVDPTNMNHDQLSLELAKGIIASNDLIQRVFTSKTINWRNDVFAVIPSCEIDEQLAMEFALNLSNQEGANILDLSSLSRKRKIDMIHPFFELESILDLNPIQQRLNASETRIWSFRHESLILARDMLNPALLLLKKKLTEAQPLILLTGAIRVNGLFKACNLLSLLDSNPANRFIVDSKNQS